MRSATLRLTALLASAAALLAAPARASDADFTLTNRTGYQIDAVYVSRRATDDWGRDIMGQDALGDGEQISITFPPGARACHFAIKVRYHDDDSTAEWGDIDLCQYEAISLYWDAKDQSTKAVGE